MEERRKEIKEAMETSEEQETIGQLVTTMGELEKKVGELRPKLTELEVELKTINESILDVGGADYKFLKIELQTAKTDFEDAD